MVPFAPPSCSVQVFDKLICKYAADAMYIPRLNLNISGEKGRSSSFMMIVKILIKTLQ